MYAIVKTGGKQYRVEQGQSLLVERLPVDDGGKATLQPLLYVDGSAVVDGDELSEVSVEARVVGHERGPKLRVVKFKPKRGYKRRNGHRQELTRIEVTEIKLASRPSTSQRAPKPVAAESASEAAAEETRVVAEQPAAEVGREAEQPAAEPKPKPTRSRPNPAASEPSSEADNGA
jgi:large subunit ribosomal protein L21